MDKQGLLEALQLTKNDVVVSWQDYEALSDPPPVLFRVNDDIVVLRPNIAWGPIFEEAAQAMAAAVAQNAGADEEKDKRFAEGLLGTTGDFQKDVLSRLDAMYAKSREMLVFLEKVKDYEVDLTEDSIKRSRESMNLVKSNLLTSLWDTAKAAIIVRQVDELRKLISPPSADNDEFLLADEQKKMSILLDQIKKSFSPPSIDRNQFLVAIETTALLLAAYTRLVRVDPTYAGNLTDPDGLAVYSFELLKSLIDERSDDSFVSDEQHLRQGVPESASWVTDFEAKQPDLLLGWLPFGNGTWVPLRASIKLLGVDYGMARLKPGPAYFDTSVPITADWDHMPSSHPTIPTLACMCPINFRDSPNPHKYTSIIWQRAAGQLILKAYRDKRDGIEHADRLETTVVVPIRKTVEALRLFLLPYKLQSFTDKFSIPSSDAAPA